jgi:ubiquinone/menaquinone biosynthesis C-methylase UbiE
MKIIDKKNLLENLTNSKEVVLELGCGNKKRIEDSIGIDAINYECVDIVGDVYEVLAKFPNNSVKAVYSYHFFEHVANLSLLMEEIARVLKDEGLLEVVVPHFSNPYFYSDYTHKNFFGLYTFSYFAKEQIFQRKTPTYERTIDFEISHVSLEFKSARPFYFRHAIKVVLGNFFNLNNYMREFYEENFCYLFPCYEIKYSLRKLTIQSGVVTENE